MKLYLTTAHEEGKILIQTRCTTFKNEPFVISTHGKVVEYIHTYIRRFRGVMIIVVGNSDTSSNPGADYIPRSTNMLGKGMNPTILLPTMDK